MRWRSSISVRPASGFIEPCIPTKALRAPVGLDWVYEIKHDGFRLLVRKHEDRVRVYTRRGADWTECFPQIVQAARKLKATSFLLDGEGIVYDSKGMPNKGNDLIYTGKVDHGFDKKSSAELRKRP